MKKTGLLSGLISLALILAGTAGPAPAGDRQAGPQGLPPGGSGVGTSSSVKVSADLGGLPVYFIPNNGQLDAQVAFYVQGKDKTIYFTVDGMTLSLAKPGDNSGNPPETRAGAADPLTAAGASTGKIAGTDGRASGSSERWTVKLDFVGADPGVRPVGETETGATISYFRGKRADWKAGLPTYSRIVYRGLWPGIDLAYYGTVGRLKYEFIVHPGADPSRIRLAYRGADSVTVDGAGRLRVATPFGDFSDDAPAAYQEVRGKRVEVPLAYDLGIVSGTGEGEIRVREGMRTSLGETPGSVQGYGFRVGAYDRDLPLVLDPALLLYCGFLGGSSSDEITAIALDVWGDAYVAGLTVSPQGSFPLTAGPDLIANGSTDAFVAKINPGGTALVYCGYIGGAGADLAYGIAVDTAGYAYVAGYTSSDQTTFPVNYGPDLTYNGSTDGFVAKLNVAGTMLLYCGYVGTADSDFGWGIAVDSSTCAYVTGYSTNASSQTDAFVAKVNAPGSGLTYYKTIAGSGGDRSYAVAVDAAGNAYVAGETASTDLPVVVGPDLTFNGGTTDAFVAKVNAAGSGLVYCGYIGGSGLEQARGIAVDILGNAYLTGYTGSDQTTFPLVGGPGLTYKGSNDAYVAKVSPGGGYLIYCGYIGGSGADGGQGIAVDASGNATVVGTTASTESTFPVREGPDLTANGGNDAFAAKVNSNATGLIYCGYVGGSAADSGLAVAVGLSGNAFVAGVTSSTEATFPAIAGPDLTQNGAEDGFVAKIYAFEHPVRKHAAGDFDGDGADEAAVDFGAAGAWLWDGGTWSQLTANNPENMVPFDIDGNGDQELAVDLGAALGLWMWNGGVWSQLTASDPEYLIAADTNANGYEELIIDFGTAGVKWRQENGTLATVTALNPQNLMAADIDGNGSRQVIGDFGNIGMWRWEAPGTSTQMTPADASAMAAVYDVGSEQGVAAALLGFGVWYWQSDLWIQLSGVAADRIIAGQLISGIAEEIACDFGLFGVWLGNGLGWTQLSGVNADDLVAADTNGDGLEEIAADFSWVGLWLWSVGGWTQLSGVDAEGLVAGDLDGDGAKELIVDFGTVGVWLWNAGAWTQISGTNPD